MAAASMGAFGTYKTEYYRLYMKEREEREKAARQPAMETVWVTQRYSPLDPRVLAPVPRHKLMVPTRTPHPPTVEAHWLPMAEAPSRSFQPEQPGLFLASFPTTRDEKWSTLRQILPSRGSARKGTPPNWGTGLGPPPYMAARQAKRMPKVNSPMTRYMDEMYAAHRLTKIF